MSATHTHHTIPYPTSLFLLASAKTKCTIHTQENKQSKPRTIPSRGWMEEEHSVTHFPCSSGMDKRPACILWNVAYCISAVNRLYSGLIHTVYDDGELVYTGVVLCLGRHPGGDRTIVHPDPDLDDIAN